MKFETKIATLLMCTTLALLSSCNKKLPDTPVQEQQVPVGFRAMSQAVWVKSGETDPDKPKFSDIHDDFGVWGIARQTGNSAPYILWETDALSQVVKSDDSDVYVPTTAAYWLKGYVYDFIAVAPFTSSGITASTVNTSSTPVMTFTYDMGAKYALRGTENIQPKDHYLFDLLGAAVKTDEIGATKPSSQDLFFWHLMSKINIGAEFKDGEDNATSGTLTSVRIENVGSKMQYTLYYATPSSDNLNGLEVDCTHLNPKNQTTLTFNESVAAKDANGKWSVHILPQVVTDFVISIDYTITENGESVTYNDVKYTMTNANPSQYVANGQYNWTFKIKPRQDISFKVEVAPWTSSDVGNSGGFDIN